MMKSLRKVTPLCLLVALVLLFYIDPFLILWWPQAPAEETGSLDMASDSIDDMFDGCRSTASNAVDLLRSSEWRSNRHLGPAWAAAERGAKTPAHQGLRDVHAAVLYMFTDGTGLVQRDLNQAVRTGKHVYRTDGFKYHYVYFYLTDAIQVLHGNQTRCRSAYHRARQRFGRYVLNAHVRLGGFTVAASSVPSLKSDDNASCFEIQTCAGADVTFYSAVSEAGQIVIPPYEVFRITHVATDEPWCKVVYKLQSTEKPRSDLNCKLAHKEEDGGADSAAWYRSRAVTVWTCVILMVLISAVLVRLRQKRFVATVMGALLLLLLIALMLRVVMEMVSALM